ncbi:hypothetical protein KKB64_04685 [Patescibacteria group bacterium]|nr:hypothetical protein [Patescibacteria group bacterium]MBU1473047.1 hypothetical protein [Patescibacteria group bacterium]MBU2460197.1 hypothetical protein [Patescibacteria group bacterium]MBU2543916.1 hypothetical protein [Patescibacteria group bacterium]
MLENKDQLIKTAQKNVVKFGQYDVAKSPLLSDALVLAQSQPEQILRTFATYHMVIQDLFKLNSGELDLISRVNKKLGKTRGANEFIERMKPYETEILHIVRHAGDTRNKLNQQGVNELATMMGTAEQLKRTEPNWKPIDGDPRSDNVIWGFVNGATDPQTNIDFAICHGIERILTQHFRNNRGLEYTKHKDWLLLALNDVVALRGSKGKYPEAGILPRWSQKRPGGLGWISQPRLDAYKADIRYGREFGKGTLLGDKGDDFFQKPIEQQVKEMGWSHACPVVDEVIKHYGDQWVKTHTEASPTDIRQGGAELARGRYAECNFVFGLIADTARELNKPLYEKLTRPVTRLENEPDGDHGLEFVPGSHLRQMSPMSTPIGYALPRVVIEQMGRGEKNINRTPERMHKALEVIEEVVKDSKTPIELTIRLSEEVSQMDADPKNVLYLLLSADILGEENCVTMFRDMVAEMRKSAPTLTRVYDEMSSAEKQDLGVVDF